MTGVLLLCTSSKSAIIPKEDSKNGGETKDDCIFESSGINIIRVTVFDWWTTWGSGTFICLT
jgi:hypothetical protein